MAKKTEFSYLGKKANKPEKKLDVFEKPEHTKYVKFETDELTGYCPVTNQPDFYNAMVEYEPNKLCIESKSLKLYFWTFRDVGIFAESLANEIANDIFKAIKPVWCKVTLEQNIRGGLKLTTFAERK